jgi:hypothetical protein
MMILAGCGGFGLRGALANIWCVSRISPAPRRSREVRVSSDQLNFIDKAAGTLGCGAEIYFSDRRFFWL